jgi:kynurenine 3-monooxygenase
MPHNAAPETITIVGAGLAGALLAILLAQRGLRVEIYERRPESRQDGVSAGRSINLALSTRGLHALQQVGLADTVQRDAIVMRGRMIHPLDATVRFQPYGQNDSEVLYAITRADLNSRLLQAATAYPGVQLQYDTQCTGVDFRHRTLHLRHAVTGRDQEVPAQRIIGTDGATSVLRRAMLSTERFNFAQHYLEHGYKELTIPPGAPGQFQLEPHALHIWPRGTYMLIALPNIDGSFTCTLFLPFVGDTSFASLASAAAVTAFFQQQFPDVVPLMPRLVEEFFAHPTGTLVTITCFPWHVADTLLLVGDAAHAMVPFYGQGMNCAFEDCTELDACIDQYYPDWEGIFHAYAQRRKANTDAIAAMALDNFLEMRDRVADPRFLLQKRIDLELERRYPGLYIPQYSLVTFHRVPYAEAQRLGAIQEQILQQLTATIHRFEDVDWATADRLITERLRTV